MSCIKGFHKSHVEMSKKATFFSKKGELHYRAWLSVRMILCASDFTQPLWKSVRPFLAGNGNIAFRVITSSLFGGCSGWQRCTTAILLMLQFSMAHLTNLFMSLVNYIWWGCFSPKKAQGKMCDSTKKGAPVENSRITVTGINTT